MSGIEDLPWGWECPFCGLPDLACECDESDFEDFIEDVPPLPSDSPPST